jgi:dTMP kinase
MKVKKTTQKPRFITFEGSDGAGKSSHISWFAEALRARGVRVTVTREPGGTAVGESWRQQLLHDKLTPETQTLLMFAARSEHLAQVIRPALANGEWVLCDRFTDATRAYQGGGHNVSTALIDAIAHWLHGNCMPDKTVLFDVPLSVSRQRLARDEKNHDRKPDRFESEPEAFQERVRNAYLELATAHPARFFVVNSEPTMLSVRQTLEKFIDEELLKS